MEVNIRLKRFEEIQRIFNKLIAKSKDMIPVWNAFIPFYQGEIEKAFQLKGKTMGQSWVGLNEGYALWKRLAMREYGWGTSYAANLILNGKLKRAATGSTADGWTQSITPTNLTMGIEGNAGEYGAKHQEGITESMTPAMRKKVFIMISEVKKWTTNKSKVPGKRGRMKTVVNEPALKELYNIANQGSVTIPQRAFFFSADGGIPGRAESKLIELMGKHFGEVTNG